MADEAANGTVRHLRSYRLPLGADSGRDLAGHDRAVCCVGELVLARPAPRPNFQPDAPPFLLRAETAVFGVLVRPPSFVRQIFYKVPTNYAAQFGGSSFISEAASSVPPLALALEHLRVAVPFWIGVSVGIFEVCRMIRRKRKTR
jgi:hypothetical protein